MAEASVEGKTLGVPSLLCVCEGNVGEKYCTDCQQALCFRCIKSHTKLSSSRHHNLIPLDQISSSPLKVKQTQAYCRKHPTRTLNQICESCLTGVCAKCKGRHKGHKLIQTELDISLVQTICAQKVPHLMKILHQLEKAKNGSPGKLELYKEAKKLVLAWRERLTRLITKDSKYLLKDLETAIKEQEQLISNILSESQTCISKADQQMTQLSDCRKISDKGILLNSISESDIAIEEAKAVLANIEATLQPVSIDDLLPMKNKLTAIEKSLHEFFTMCILQNPTQKALNKDSPQRTTLDKITPLKHPTPSVKSKVTKTKKPNYGQLKRLCQKSHLGSGRCYRICGCNDVDNDNVVILDSGSYTVMLFDVNTQTLNSFLCTRRIHRMCTLDMNTHVIIEDGTRDVHVLNGSFTVINTMPSANDRGTYTPSGVCRKHGNVFVISEKGTGARTRFTEASVVDGQLSILTQTVVDESDCDGIMSIHPDMNHVTLQVGGFSLSTVNLNTGACTRIDLTQHIDSPIGSMCVDDESTILVGDMGGRVHTISGTKYNKQILEHDKWVTGLTVRGDKISVISGTQIHVYK